MAETQTVKSKRDILGERLKAKYPDREYADDEALFGQINDDYDEYDNKLKGYKDSEAKFAGMINQYPQSAQFIADMANGKNPWVAMVEQLGIDGITDIFENPQYKEEIAKAQDDYLERKTKNDELANEYENNIDETIKMLEAVQQEKNLSDEQVDEVWAKIVQIANDAIVGKASRETFDMVSKAINHDTDVEQARDEGKISGRNERIVAKLNKEKTADGVPNLAGTNNAPTRKRSSSIFDIAAAAR
jgi:hypothetical protein